MKTDGQIIREEMRKLITKSCSQDNEDDKYYGFHKSLLKFYFGVVDAIIDYDNEVISLVNRKPVNTKADNIYDINQSIASKVNYTNLEETLKGCLEKGNLQNRFYQSMLFHYNNLTDLDPETSISA